MRPLKERFAYEVSAGKGAQNGFVGIHKDIVVAQLDPQKAKPTRIIEVAQGKVAANVAVDHAVVEVAFDVESAAVRKSPRKASAEVVAVASDSKKAHLGDHRKHKPFHAFFTRAVAQTRQKRFPEVEFIVDRIHAVFVGVRVVEKRQAVLVGYVAGLLGIQCNFARGNPVSRLCIKGIGTVLHGGQAQILGAVAGIKVVVVVNDLAAGAVSVWCNQRKISLRNHRSPLGPHVGLA